MINDFDSFLNFSLGLNLCSGCHLDSFHCRFRHKELLFFAPFHVEIFRPVLQ